MYISFHFASRLMLLLACKLNKAFVTMLTFVRPFTSMNSFVGLHISLLYKSFATKSTFVFFQIHVNFFMPSKRTLRKKRKEKEWEDYEIEFLVCRNMFYLKSGILYCKIYKAALWTLNGSWRERVNSFFELFYCILHTQHPIRRKREWILSKDVSTIRAYFRQ